MKALQVRSSGGLEVPELRELSDPWRNRESVHCLIPPKIAQ
jgi:hypothetical protein